MPRPLRIALCQLNSTPEHHANIRALEDALKTASEGNCNIAIFPEYFLQGIVADSPDKIYEHGKGPQEDLAQLARMYEIDIVIGTLVEKHASAADDQAGPAEGGDDNAREHKVYNTSYYFDKTGKVLCAYRKRNLWHPEKDYLNAGEEHHLVFQTSYAKTGLLVCWDLAWPEAFRALFVQGVELVIVPTYWTADDLTEVGKKQDPDAVGEMAFLDSLVVARAYENECVVAFVNVGGPKEQGYLGRSAVAAPLRGVVGRTDGPEAQVKIVDIDLDVLQSAKQVYGIRKDYHAAIARNGFSHPPELSK